MKRTDKNQREIMSALRQIGCSVYDLSMVGKGVPDIVVGYRGRTVLMEIKTLTGKLEETQKEFFKTFNGEAVVVRTMEEAIKYMTERR